MILVLLFGVGYGAVTWELSHKEHVTLKAVSMSFVSSQGTPNLSNWNDEQWDDNFHYGICVSTDSWCERLQYCCSLVPRVQPILSRTG